MNFPSDPVKRNRRHLVVRMMPLVFMVSGVASGQQKVDWTVVDKYCTACHNLDDFAGGTDLDLLDRKSLASHADTWERVIRKVRTGMMPPAGKPRPARATLDAFTKALGANLDAEYARAPNPGNVGVARLNREEYRNAIRDVLQFDASHVMASIPAESSGAGFDNNIDLLSVSPTLIDAYASAAMRISREAVGDLSLIPSEAKYDASSKSAEELPLGSRGGLAVTHNFPVDALYEITVDSRSGGPFGNTGFCTRGNQLVVSIDGELVKIENPGKFQLPFPAGKHTVTAALQDVRRCTGVNDYFDDYSVDGGVADIKINGPFEIKGAGDTPSRRAIFSCYPQAQPQEQTCARQNLARLATRAWRRPIANASDEVAELMTFYGKGQKLGGFEMGMQYAIARLLMDPRFLYQVEQEPADLRPGSIYAVNDIELASRLSFFLWSSVPDDKLLELASSGRLHERGILEAQVRRMLSDTKAEALVHNFAGQWLKLRELAAAQPEDRAYTPQLADAFRQETELMFADFIREDRGVLSLFDSNYTWLNERLAQHYGIADVRGDYMRRVPLPPGSPRRGLLGQGSILTATSVANRTSPVIRGRWIVEDILGAPVPTPPPGVETDLTNKNVPAGIVINTLRDRIELHRANPTCAACHQIMDPIGLSLENFDLIGRWRTKENGFALNTHTTLIDGTPIDGPQALRTALLGRGDALVSNFIEKLLSYSLGRHLDSPDMSAVRKIATDSSSQQYKFSDIVLGIVESAPFRMKIVPKPATAVVER